MPTLVHIPYSPWSERARWAVRAAGQRVPRQVYTPTLSEPWLRVHMGRWPWRRA